jgi:hypothetical protein
MRVRNVRRYASPKCSTNRDSKRRGISAISNSNHQGKSDLENSTFKPANTLLAYWKFFGIWIFEFPANRKFREAGLLA